MGMADQRRVLGVGDAGVQHRLKPPSWTIQKKCANLCHGFSLSCRRPNQVRCSCACWEGNRNRGPAQIATKRRLRLNPQERPMLRQKKSEGLRESFALLRRSPDQAETAR